MLEGGRSLRLELIQLMRDGELQATLARDMVLTYLLALGELSPQTRQLSSGDLLVVLCWSLRN